MKEFQMDDFLPAASLAHFVMKARNIEQSFEFYVGLGLRAFGKFPGLAIVELRGGTHLLLVQKEDNQFDVLQNSRVGQRPEFGNERIDLMIAGRTKTDLELYRDKLVTKGYEPSVIPDGDLYGHHYFSLEDPDGNGVSFYTNHSSDKPI